MTTHPRLSTWAIHYYEGFHSHTLLTLARTAKGARINLENDWATMPLKNEDDDQHKWAYPTTPHTRNENADTIYDLQGPYTSGVQELITGDERIATEKKWTDVAREDKGLSVEKVRDIPYDQKPALWCFCWDGEKRVQKCFYTIAGVIRHAWIKRINQRSIHVSALDG